MGWTVRVPSSMSSVFLLTCAGALASVGFTIAHVCLDTHPVLVVACELRVAWVESAIRVLSLTLRCCVSDARIHHSDMARPSRCGLLPTARQGVVFAHVKMQRVVWACEGIVFAHTYCRGLFNWISSCGCALCSLSTWCGVACGSNGLRGRNTDC